jgi:hypothetical protein
MLGGISDRRARVPSLPQDEGLGGLCKVPAQARHGGRREIVHWVTDTDLFQRCFKCTDAQLNQQPVQFDRYEGENPDKRFVTPDDYKGYQPEYWSSAHSADDTAVSAPSGAPKTGRCFNSLIEK